MKTASKVLLTVGGVIHIVNAVGFFMSSLYMIIASIAYFVTGSFAFAEWFPVEEAGEEAGTAMGIAFMVCAIVFIALSIMFIGFGILSIIASKKAFQAKNERTKGLCITAIVLGAILDNTPAVVGGIFGLIALGKNEKEPPEDGSVVD